MSKNYTVKKVWKKIEGYDYYVSNCGDVKNIKTGRLLKPQENTNGYLLVRLYNQDGFKQFLIQRLVATAFIPNPENKPTVDHISRDRQDNRVENLRWATMIEQAGNKKERKHRYQVQCIETGEIFQSANAAAISLGKKNAAGNILAACRSNRIAYNYHWQFI